jgi:hypothetical protein
MCLITNQTEPIILEKDLFVYKFCKKENNKIKPYFYDKSKLIYKKNVLNIENIKNSSDDYRRTEFFDRTAKNYLFENSNPSIYDLESMIESNKLKSISSGFHFIASKQRIKLCNNYEHLKVYTFIIPKGSEVYFDASELGVTNKIMYVSKIKFYIKKLLSK